jgi:hypothetical protein
MNPAENFEPPQVLIAEKRSAYSNTRSERPHLLDGDLNRFHVMTAAVGVFEDEARWPVLERRTGFGADAPDGERAGALEDESCDTCLDRNAALARLDVQLVTQRRAGSSRRKNVPPKRATTVRLEVREDPAKRAIRPSIQRARLERNADPVRILQTDI